jgi:hypothetical protein
VLREKAFAVARQTVKKFTWEEEQMPKLTSAEVNEFLQERGHQVAETGKSTGSGEKLQIG